MLKNWAPGTVLTSSWLVELGVSKDLARRYVASGWLERIGRGAYIRAEDSVDWQGALYSIQTQLGLSVHVAGLSALNLKGLGHYLPMRKETAILLISDGPERMPSWFSKTNWGVEITHHCATLFDSSRELPLGVVEHKGFEFGVSMSERAAFEMLYCVKSNAEFNHARTLFNGLGTLRPQETQRLLKSCRSVRVRRLFLWMARECAHPWFKYLDLGIVDIGKGKRVVYKGGMLDGEFLITVPRKKRSSDV